MEQFKPIKPWKFYLLCGTPFYLLLALKLTGMVEWSWWWITLPVWLPLAVFALLLLMLAMLVLWPRVRRRHVRRDLWQ